MLFLTFNDAPSGIYYSQVTDVCNFLNSQLSARIRLVAFISIRNYWANKRKIILESPRAMVIPMFPGVGNWRFNYFFLLFLFLFIDSKKIIARGPFAAFLALKLKKTGLVNYVCFDGRGAYEAELNEYDVSQNNHLKKTIRAIEKSVVLNADHRIAVSHKLIHYWIQQFGYHANEHTVIPCTFHSEFLKQKKREDESAIRKSMGFSDQDVVFVHSGSYAGWQSLRQYDSFLSALLANNPLAKLLILSNAPLGNMKFANEYKSRVVVQWMAVDKVSGILQCCDYGLLLRQRSITNEVSSPVKFAEYLAAGLPVLISDNIGDYSDFVKKNHCGQIITPVSTCFDFKRVSVEDKARIKRLAQDHFSKVAYIAEYKKALKLNLL